VTISFAIRRGVDMNNLDKQIMAAERELDASAHGGFTPAWAELLQTPADHMLALLVERADALMGCPEGSPEEAELATLTDAIEARPLRVFGNEQGKVYAHTEHPPRGPSNMQAVCTATQPNNGRTSEIVRNPSGRFRGCG
jgi:hypothetical protein